MEEGKGLAYVLEQQAVFKGQLHPVDIKSVQNEADIWSLFTTIEEVVRPGDQVILDITNSFRFMPMLGMVLLNYLKVTKGIVVKGIYYGNFEAQENGVAPLMNLTHMAQLQDWTNATHSFVVHGISKGLEQLIHQEVMPYLKVPETRKAWKPFDGFKRSLKAITTALQTNRGTILVDGGLFKQLDESLAAINNRPLIAPLHPLLQLIQTKTQHFSRKEDWRNGLYAVEWCIEHGLIQQGITMLQETVVTYLCEKAGFDYKTKSERDEIAGVLYRLSQGRKEDLSTQQLDSSYQRTLPFLSKELLAAYNSLKDKARNDINHGGFSSVASPEKLENSLTDNFKIIKDIVLREP